MRVIIDFGMDGMLVSAPLVVPVTTWRGRAGGGHDSVVFSEWAAVTDLISVMDLWIYRASHICQLYRLTARLSTTLVMDTNGEALVLL